MPELPEITCRAREMRDALVGKTINGIEVLQPKCLNVPPEEFSESLTGGVIEDVTHHGKWIFVRTRKGYLLLNMGMGGEILVVTRDTLPEKRRVVFDFDDGTCLSINFWWFGYAHYTASGALDTHAMTAKQGPNALDVSVDELANMLNGRRGRIKSFLLDQSKIAGVGNATVHDILFLARLHPLRQINTLTENEIEALANAIHHGLQPSIEAGGAFYEVNLHGKPGGFTAENLLVGYREGKPCPVCGTTIEKIKTGSTASFVCPQCQPLEPK
ncbi:MAG TPA: DNA-formamidopyrimidine glycosylase family protein [Phycisphaerae bacterium]|nr:DNA-formamidopyrimidine glycosylase family protein [Phycisphaerae bacterium]